MYKLNFEKNNKGRKQSDRQEKLAHKKMVFINIERIAVS